MWERDIPVNVDCAGRWGLKSKVVAAGWEIVFIDINAVVLLDAVLHRLVNMSGVS